MSALTADQIRQGLRLPDNEAGRAVADALVEKPGDATEIEGYLSSDELAPDSRIMNAFRQLTPPQQVAVLSPLARGLQAPSNIGGRSFQVSAASGANIPEALQMAQARVNNPNPAAPAGSIMDLAGPAQAAGRQHIATQAKVVGWSLLTAAGCTAAAVGTGILVAGTAPVWGTVAVVAGVVGGVVGGYNLISSLF